MSQASNHVKWCLAKAEKEIEASKRLGKSPKHKGILKIEPDIGEAEGHIAKAEHNLKAVTRFKEIGFSDWSIAAGFYSIYHCFLAIASKFGYESKNQVCTVALIEWLKEENKVDIDSRFIDMLKQADIEEIQESKVIEMREEYTYGTKVSFEDDIKINKIKADCREIIDKTKSIVYKEF